MIYKIINFRLIFFCVLLPFCVFSQNNKYENIDIKALAIKYLNAIEAISAEINSFAKTDEEKTRAMFVWITNNIAYDTKAFFSGNYPEPDVKITLKNKKAVCEGYCLLFKTFCDLNKIPCITMNGYSKGVGYSPGKSFSNTDHTWNIVKIGEEWKLIESTWGAGYVTSTGFEKQFFDQYFFASPEKFILNHLPADPMWQLLSCEVPLYMFEKDTNSLKNFLENKKCVASQNPKIADYYALDSINRFRVFNENAYAYNPKNEDGLVQLSFIYTKFAYDNIQILNRLDKNSDKSKTTKLATDAKQFLLKAQEYIKKVKSKESYFQQSVSMQNQVIPQNMEYLDWFLNKK